MNISMTPRATYAAAPRAEAISVSASGNRDRMATRAEIDPVTQQAKPLRFPWLSLTALRAGAAAEQHARFVETPVVGEIVDKQA